MIVATRYEVFFEVSGLSHEVMAFALVWRSICWPEWTSATTPDGEIREIVKSIDRGKPLAMSFRDDRHVDAFQKTVRIIRSMGINIEVLATRRLSSEHSHNPD